ncbi:MAG: hypothetical protein ACPGYX_12040, partial [Oceanobacter sp.]
TSSVVRDDGSVLYGLKVHLDDLDVKRDLVSLVYGDSEHWVKERAARQPDWPVRKTLKFLFGSGIQASRDHVKQLWKNLFASKDKAEA